MGNAAETVIAIGTKKGLWLARSTDRASWILDGPYFLNIEVASVAIDTRGGRTRVLAGINDWHWGPAVVHSDDLGATWTEPEHGAIKFPADTGAELARIWHLRPDTDERPGVVWAGCEPISVWKSTDSGESFELNRGLWEHPHRKEWGEGFGGPAAHTIIPDREDAKTLHVAMSTGGVYRSRDAGGSWEPRNKGISAGFMPDEEPEFGQCVHRITADAADHNRLYAQNHGGVYRTDNGGDEWVSIADGLPADFGFTFLTHPRRAGTAWTIPLHSDFQRIPVGGRLALWRTDDAGLTWAEQREGLPDGEYNVVLRDAAWVDEHDGVAGLYFGTRAGEVFASSDEGASFSQVAERLPDVLSVRAAIVA
ncbi:WD40/YVTN/BNR-like repeat-containing protein [Zafaria sp. J156]|uniref:WD40/YVTN/BNR-like repeat-containing protein n=1 Tax=Zafaria sp. J156 TaxID=3116490 RepID=UPI002E76BB13|nr:exo-alpha-sialidase [Zafaria sp. J156]MEE1621057.1 exo-alpha-sialidase [Zafaria sp. J156]